MTDESPAPNGINARWPVLPFEQATYRSSAPSLLKSQNHAGKLTDGFVTPTLAATSAKVPSRLLR